MLSAVGILMLVRHGQASFGADDYDVLSETGWEQSRQLGSWLVGRGVRPDLVLRGGMRRHRETAEGIATGLGSDPLAREDLGWDEFDHLGVVAAQPGPVEASGSDDPRRAFQRSFERATARWTSGSYDADYPESFGSFADRVGAALERTVGEAGSGRTVLVVTSGGPIAAAVAGLVAPDGDATTRSRLWSSFNTPCVNTGVTRVVVGATGARLLTFNEHTHLGPELLTYR
jgi:broad specificity phosphatase PhoE